MFCDCLTTLHVHAGCDAVQCNTSLEGFASPVPPSLSPSSFSMTAALVTAALKTCLCLLLLQAKASGDQPRESVGGGQRAMGWWIVA